jgi:TrmH family RNA methyltransferase
VDAVLVCDPQCDVFNPNTIRASLGAVFTVPVAVANDEAALVFLQKNNIRIIATHLDDTARPLYDCDLCGPLAIVLGAEASGISEFWVKHANERTIIPMCGQVDSLNVSATAAIAVFEAVRQRCFGWKAVDSA